MKPLNPGLSSPGKDVIGPSSPVVQCMLVLRAFFSNSPSPNLDEADAKTCGALLANHLFRLQEGCGMLNIAGMHSAAVALLRSMEDAYDCFAACTQVPGAASKWMRGELRPSDAAKLWTANFQTVTMTGAGGEITLPEYRKHFRSAFAKYSHCSYALCSWDLFFNPKPQLSDQETVHGTIEINFSSLVIDRNGHSIDAHLIAHLLEFEQEVRRAYSQSLAESEYLQELSKLQPEILKIMRLHDEHGCQDVHVPPELRKLGPKNT